MNVVELISLSACLLATLSGSFLSYFWIRMRKGAYRSKIIRARYLDQAQEVSNIKYENKKFSEMVLKFVQSQSDRIRLKPNQFYFIQKFWLISDAKFKELSRQAGVGLSMTQLGFSHSRALLCIGGGACCALVGMVFSLELMFLGLALGAFLGWRVPSWSLKKQIESRKQDLENHLSEMLEVISLGLRSGLSFDQSFELYHGHFQTNLGTQAASIQHQWHLGLTTREDALRDFAQTYDSHLFSRLIENIIRSLRFGAPLADSFDSAALEARLIHKSHREEEVAKAPVKMLIPIASLILPAMLLLVLGPVLLDMMQGF